MVNGSHHQKSQINHSLWGRQPLKNTMRQTKICWKDQVMALVRTTVEEIKKRSQWRDQLPSWIHMTMEVSTMDLMYVCID